MIIEKLMGIATDPEKSELRQAVIVTYSLVISPQNVPRVYDIFKMTPDKLLSGLTSNSGYIPAKNAIDIFEKLFKLDQEKFNPQHFREALINHYEQAIKTQIIEEEEGEEGIILDINGLKDQLEMLETYQMLKSMKILDDAEKNGEPSQSAWTAIGNLEEKLRKPIEFIKKANTMYETMKRETNITSGNFDSTKSYYKN